jgi:hypothetical protein
VPGGPVADLGFPATKKISTEKKELIYLHLRIIDHFT